MTSNTEEVAFKLPDNLLQPLTCTRNCTRINEPLPSPTDLRYLELEREIGTAFSLQMMLELKRVLIPKPHARLIKYVRNIVQETVIKLGSPPPSILPDDFFSDYKLGYTGSVFASEFDAAFYLSQTSFWKLHFVAPTNAHLLPSYQVWTDSLGNRCLHWYFEHPEWGQYLKDVLDVNSDNFETNYLKTPSIYENLIGWIKFMLLKKKLDKTLWGNDWESKIREFIFQAILYGFRAEREAMDILNIHLRLSLELFLQNGFTVKTWKTFLDVCMMYENTPRSSKSLVDRQQETSLLQEQYFETISLFGSARKCHDFMNYKGLFKGVQLTSDELSRSVQPYPEYPIVKRTSAWLNPKAPVLNVYIPSLTIAAPTIPVVAKSKSAARRARNKLAAKQRSASTIQPSTSSLIASNPSTTSIESDLLIASEMDSLIESSTFDISKVSISEVGIEGSSLNPIVPDSIVRDGSDYDNLPGLDDATDSDSDSD